jgi:prolyl oligopeptidase
MMKNKLAYSKTRTMNQIDDYHSTQLSDPYRLLEEIDSPDKIAWVKVQDEVTFSYLEQIPGRDRLHQRLTNLCDYSRAMTIHQRGKKFFQFRNSGLQNQDVMYVKESPPSVGLVLLDPNALSRDGTIFLNAWSVSEDGNWLAYAIAHSGSDWVEWRNRNVEVEDDIPDNLAWSKVSGSGWAYVDRGFYSFQ